MSGFLLAALGVLGGFALAAVGDMVSEEFRNRLDHLPHAILRLAAMRLAHAQRATFYKIEWLPELTYILKGDEARPVTRLYHGTRFAIGILASANRIAGDFRSPEPAQSDRSQLLVRTFDLRESLQTLQTEVDLLSRKISSMTYEVADLSSTLHSPEQLTTADLIFAAERRGYLQASLTALRERHADRVNHLEGVRSLLARCRHA